ncbi:hypothetical protein [Planctomicrobium sp. SH664]|uniref:hypothetical protein n=1 Tax=Planctomicrobium sp. SH664 TaxID=3448125 RepID=UPI003F5C9938
MTYRPFGKMIVDGEARELVAACAQGVATDQQWQRLEELLRSRPDVADYYVSQAVMSQHLRRTWAMLLLKWPKDVSEGRRNAASKKRVIHLRRWIFAGAVALLAATLIPFSLSDQSVRVSPEFLPVAWAEAATGVKRLLPGARFRQLDGQATIRFKDGTTAKHSGEVDLHVISPSKVDLRLGQLEVEGGSRGRGFTVTTELVDVFDLGAVFGVQVDPSGVTHVAVFEGRVNVILRGEFSESDSRNPILNTGEAIRVEPSGEVSRVFTIWHDVALSTWSTTWRGKQQPVIASVQEQLSMELRPRFYSIVPGGFGEDVRAFVDRPDQWNGVDEAGLPRELIGGDYIRMYMDDRYLDPLQIVVTLNRPANLYILYHDGVPPPNEWLVSNFQPTGLKVGLDEGDYSEANAPPSFSSKDIQEVGPGRSIDDHFSVWKRTMRDDLTVTLGSVRLEGLKAGFAMYGIVAVPLEE